MYPFLNDEKASRESPACQYSLPSHGYTSLNPESTSTHHTKTTIALSGLFELSKESPILNKTPGCEPKFLSFL